MQIIDLQIFIYMDVLLIVEIIDNIIATFLIIKNCLEKKLVDNDDDLESQKIIKWNF